MNELPDWSVIYQQLDTWCQKWLTSSHEVTDLADAYDQVKCKQLRYGSLKPGHAWNSAETEHHACTKSGECRLIVLHRADFKPKPGSSDQAETAKPTEKQPIHTQRLFFPVGSGITSVVNHLMSNC